MFGTCWVGFLKAATVLLVGIFFPKKVGQLVAVSPPSFMLNLPARGNLLFRVKVSYPACSPPARGFRPRMV